MDDARARHEAALRAEIGSLTKRRIRVEFDRDRGIHVAWLGAKTAGGARYRAEWTTPVGALRRLRNKLQPPISPQVERPQPRHTLEAPPKERLSDWWPVASAVFLAVCAGVWKLME